MINFEPLKDRLAVKRDEAEDYETETGILIQKEFAPTPQEGTVLAIGPDVKDVRVGDRVMFGKHDGSPQQVGDEKFLIMKENQIWGVLDA